MKCERVKYDMGVSQEDVEKELSKPKCDDCSRNLLDVKFCAKCDVLHLPSSRIYLCDDCSNKIYIQNGIIKRIVDGK